MAASASAAFGAARPFHPPFEESVLKAGLRAAPPFPAGLFSPELAKIVADFAASCSAPTDYIGASILACAGAAIGNARRGQAFEQGGWAVPPIIWVGLVGEPSTLKTPSIRMATSALAFIEKEIGESFRLTLRQFNTDKAAAEEEHEVWARTVKAAVKDRVPPPEQPERAVAPDKPVRPRLIFNDTTPEAAQVLVSKNPKLLCARDELAGFLDFDRYSSNGKPYWLEAYEGDFYTVDRKNADGCIAIEFNGISVLGGTQPDKLVEVFKGANDGLAARFFWIWPEDNVEFSPPTSTADDARWLQIVRSLHGLRPVLDPNGTAQAVNLKLEPTSVDTYVRWRRANARSASDAGPLYKGFVGKLPGMVMRLALILELLDWAEFGGSEPDTICDVVMLRTIAFVEEYAKPMARRVFGDAERPEVERNAATLARHIIKKKLRAINLSKLRSAGLPGLRDADALSETAEFLVETGWLTFTGQRAGGTSGRMSKDYAVNPGVHFLGNEAAA